MPIRIIVLVGALLFIMPILSGLIFPWLISTDTLPMPIIIAIIVGILMLSAMIACWVLTNLMNKPKKRKRKTTHPSGNNAS